MTNKSNLITLNNAKFNSYFLFTKVTRNHYLLQGIGIYEKENKN